ncbi:MAG: UvrB/UvrC motif-containing protein [Oscillospiraceae bacterium]
MDFRRGFKKSGVPADLVRGAAAKMLEFELAASLRDQIIELRGQ